MLLKSMYIIDFKAAIEMECNLYTLTARNVYMGSSDGTFYLYMYLRVSYDI